MIDLPDTPDADDLLAAEYVMGLLDGADWRAARLRADTDGAFAARVQAWENRLAPLNDAYGSAPLPPDLWPKIAAQVVPAPRRKRRWAVVLGGLITASVALGLVWLAQLPAPQPALQAELVVPDTGLMLRVAARGDRAELRLTGPAAGAGLDYELWVIEGEAPPVSLGVLRDGQTRLDAPLRAGAVLAISLEPVGGSPTGQPTSPVLATAQITDA
jgi:anti-sigma-K factor RskA